MKLTDADLTDLVAFFTSRLDEAERDARTATPGPWHIPEHDPVAYCVDSPDGSGRICRFGDRSCSDDVHNSLHIVRNEPRAVLASVAADRHLLAELEACQGDAAWDEALVFAVRCRAMAWDSHPGYKPAWKP